MENGSKHLVLHVGLPKALSSFLQTVLFPHLPDTYYEGQVRSPNNVLTQIIQGIISYEDPLTWDGGAARERVSRALDAIPEDNVLISEEALFGCYFNNYRDKRVILELLKESFPSAKLLVVIRRQDKLVESLYKHMLKVGHSVAFDQYINLCNDHLGDYRYREGLNIDVKQLDFDAYVSYAEELFGEAGVTVLPFELFLRDREAFLAELFRRTGLPCHYLEEYPYVNRAYSALSCSLARVFNRYFQNPVNPCGFIPQRPFYEMLCRRSEDSAVYNFLRKISYRCTFKDLLETVDKIFYSKASFCTKAVRELILAHHRESNRQLSRRYELELGRYGYF